LAAPVYYFSTAAPAGLQQKRELENKEEPTVPARVFVPRTDIYETANAWAVVMEIEAGPKGGPPDDRRAGFNFPGFAKPRGLSAF
jgi:hypothetical protein